MKIIRLTSLSTVLIAAALLTGCGSMGVGDILGGGSDTGTYDPYNSASDVQGTVERVDTRNRLIVVDSDTEYRSNLRNGDNRYGNEVVLYYDERTSVAYGGQTYNPADLEVGDRIRADVEQTGDRLMAEQIEVLRDASTGSSSAGTNTGGIGGDLRSDELRGTVRYLDTRNRTLEVEPSRYSSNFSTGRSTGQSNNNVLVYYDAETIVEFEGQRYSPENLERGDVVEVEVRELGGRLVAEEILVVGDGRTGR